ncbi:MAG: hypothetical protein Q9198_004768, partial [Flavoplaca austrocitrina]
MNHLKGPGDGLGRTGAQTNIGFNHDDSTSILTNPEGNGTSDGNSCALSPIKTPSNNGPDGHTSTSLPLDSQLSTACDGNSFAPGLDNSQMNIESAVNDSTSDAANPQSNTSSDCDLVEPKKPIRRTRSIGISEVDVSGNDAPAHQWTWKWAMSKASPDAITDKKKTLPNSTAETTQQQLDSQLTPTQYASADNSPHGQKTWRKDHTKPQKRGRADSSNLQDGDGKEDSVLSEEGASRSLAPLKRRRQGNRRVSFARQDAIAGEEDLNDAQDNRPDKQRDETLNDKWNEYKEVRERLLRQAAPQGGGPSVQSNALVPQQVLKNKRLERMLAQKEDELLEQQVKKEDAQKAAREQRTKQRHLR